MKPYVAGRWLAAGLLAINVGCTPKLPAGDGALPARGFLWLDHHTLQVSDSIPIELSTNGTQVFVQPRAGGPPPGQRMLSVHAPALSPGLNVAGVRICYAVIGDKPETKVFRLRLAQGRYASSPPPSPYGYVVAMDADNVAALSPTPPPGGFSYNDPVAFVCVTSEVVTPPCLDPTHGTISAGIGVEFGDADDRLVINGIGLQYDRTCTPNPLP